MFGGANSKTSREAVEGHLAERLEITILAFVSAVRKFVGSRLVFGIG